ncbi:RimJ/RimL family protein N-acetyltransferase [Neisseria sp. HSC-16F19]|nr:RimJ/RimL family protein N-acetyltransferase [Neisseria sp. HSC-16F19]
MSLTAMQWVQPVVLNHRGVRLEPLGPQHEAGLRRAAADGELWRLRVTSVPEPDETAAYIQTAIDMPDRFAFAVIDAASGEVLGSSSYHDILPQVKRLEIGYTWYAQSRWRGALNTTCKLMLMTHAFETLGAQVVGWRTDIENTRSQAAIERLGARKDGTIRGNALRRDGTVRDTVMYSLTAAEWPDVKQQLQAWLAR